MIALDKLSWGKFGFGYSAGTNSSEIVFVVYALCAAKFLVTIFPPFGDQIGISPLLVDTVVIKILADFL